MVFVIGDPILRNRAAEVPVEMINSDEIKKLVDQMKKVLRNYSLVGLAAPQIGVPSRVIVMEASERLLEKYPKNVYETRQMSILPLTVSIDCHCITIATKHTIFQFHSCFRFYYKSDSYQSGAESEKFQYKNVPGRLCVGVRLCW